MSRGGWLVPAPNGAQPAGLAETRLTANPWTGASTPAWRRRLLWLMVVHLSVWTLLPVLLYANAPLDVVEIVAWGRTWQWGYDKHPPLPSWVAEGAANLGGQYAANLIYLLSQLSVVASFAAVWWTALRLLGPAGAFVSVFVLEATSFHTWVTMEWNHAVAVLPWIALAVMSWLRALETGRLGWWLMLGAAVGVGMLCKYLIGLVAAGMLVFHLIYGFARRHLRGPGPYLAAAVAALVVLPHVLWVIDHDFTTLTYAMRRARSGPGAGHLLNPLQFVAGQAANVGLLFVVVAPLLRWPLRWCRLGPAMAQARAALAFAVLGPIVLLLLFSLVSGRQLNTAWGMPFYSMLGLLVLLALETRANGRALRRAVALALLVAVVNVGIAAGKSVLGPLRGKASRTHIPGRELADQVTAIWHERHGTSLQHVAGERWIVDNVSFYSLDRPLVIVSRDLWNSELDLAANAWTSVEDFRRRGGVLLWYADREGLALPPSLRQHFPGALVLKPLVLPYRTWFEVEPVRVGVAVVEPRQ